MPVASGLPGPGRATVPPVAEGEECGTGPGRADVSRRLGDVLKVVTGGGHGGDAAASVTHDVRFRS
jgi:hypothetical protein